MVSETVLRTVLFEVQFIMNKKSQGYLSFDVADPDSLAPNILIMCHQDSSLPQAVYDSTNLLGTHCWKHSQVLADPFWFMLIYHFLPGLQERQ